MRPPIAAFSLALLAFPAQAQALRDFCADRPGKATPPCILDAGHLQMETGLVDAVFIRGGGHEEVYALGASELRFGGTRRVEVEAGWTPAIIDRVRGAGRTLGVGDAFVGARAALTDPDKDGAAASLQAFVTLPTATHGLGAGGWTAGIRLPIALPLGATGLGLTPEVDVLRNSDDHGTHLGLQGAASLSRGFGPFTLGAELWGQMDDDPAGRVWQASADLTAAYALGKNGQLDAGLNVGLNHATPDAELYVGVARRF